MYRQLTDQLTRNGTNMSTNLNSFSRFRDTEPILVQNNTTFGLWVRPNFLQPGFLGQSDIINIKVDQSRAGRPDLISLDLYGTDEFDWIIIMFNRPLTLNWPQVGIIIQAPTKDAVTRNW